MCPIILLGLLLRFLSNVPFRNMQSIAARRKREAAERELVASVKANQDLEAKIRFSNRNHTATSTKTPESGDTEERKGRLRNLLESEEQQCLHRIASYQETPDQRNKRLVDLAIRLKKDREDERLRFVTEMLEEREKTSSDEARTLAAKEAEADTAAILLMQIEDKRASRARDQDEERLLEELWHRDYASKLAREQLEARRRADANVILRQALDQQIKDKLSRATPNEFIEDVYIKGERCDQTRLHRPHPAAHVAILKKPTSPREDTIVAKMVQEEKVRLLAEIQVQERQAARLREYIADHHLYVHSCPWLFTDSETGSGEP